MHNIKRMHT